MSWPGISGEIPLTGGDIDDEAIEMLLSDAANGLATRGAFVIGGVGGARPLPLPRTRPPPNLRPDMMKNFRNEKPKPKRERGRPELVGLYLELRRVGDVGSKMMD